MHYTIETVENTPDLTQGPDGPEWQRAEQAALACFRPEGSSHRPVTTVRLLHDGSVLYGLFHVQDRFVLSRYRNYMDPVYTDSCVEFFVKPMETSGYFNFEFNCGGTLLCSYITDPTRTPDGFRQWTPVDAADAAGVTVSHSLPQTVDPELAEPVTWWLAFSIPVSLMETYAGPIGPLAGRTLRGNFYKCADGTTHPHWVSWAPVRELNFHQPACFGQLHCR